MVTPLHQFETLLAWGFGLSAIVLSVGFSVLALFAIVLWLIRPSR